jgi:hypothetical protein
MMRTKSTARRRAFILLIMLIGLLLAACSVPTATQPVQVSPPAVQTELPGTGSTPTIAETEPPDAGATPTAPPSGDDQVPIEVADVSIQVGEGSPIPVDAFVSGSWPGLCAQIATINQQLEGERFTISIKATPAVPNCPPDQLDLPFRIALPLNMVAMPPGAYTVWVNGVETNFDWAGSAETRISQVGEGDLRPIAVEDVRVETGAGSPIPVDVVVSGSWPDLCAQIAQIEQRVDGSRVEISIQATPATADCPPDPAGLPFRIAIPLNMAEMELGSYTVVVNGIETSFEWARQPGTGGV